MALNFIHFRFPGLSGVRCAFQTRTPGVSGPCGGNISWDVDDDPASVLENRRSLVRDLGLDAFAELHQIHTDNLVFDPAPVAPEDRAVMDADGMATTRPGLGLCIKTADCQPILLAHRDGRHIAALHAGWRGNRCDFPGSGVARFCEQYGLLPRDVLAVRGPSLGPAAAQFINFEREWGADFAAWFAAREQTMDLWSLTRAQLRAAGLPDSHIFGLDCCTATMNDLFFSYRRSRHCGRQASVIWIAR